MSRVTLAQATTIAHTALETARARQFAPIAVAVVDAGGHLAAFLREDGAGFARYPIAYGKAWGALGMGFGSRELAARAEQFPTFIAAIATATEGRIVPSPGGVLIGDASGDIIGAVGISGDTGANDEICAVAGIEAAGLRAVTE